MKSNPKVLIVSAGLVILGLYYFYKQNKQDAEIAKDNTSSSPSTSGTQNAKADFSKVLKKGSQGVEVGVLQKALKTLKVDNDFGTLTETRLKKVMGVTQTSINKYNEFIKNKK
jgi:hypothetical protein